MRVNIKELAVFGMLGAVMCVSKFLTEWLPNIHLLGVFTVAITVVYRKKALYPLYTFVFLIGLCYGFPNWWPAYIYIWAILWGATMLLPQKMPEAIKPFAYIGVCALHGFLFGILYAPTQALLFGLDFKGMMIWIIKGLPWDLIHGVSNLVCGSLIVPIVTVLKQAQKYTAN